MLALLLLHEGIFLFADLTGRIMLALMLLQERACLLLCSDNV